MFLCVAFFMIQNHMRTLEMSTFFTVRNFENKKRDGLKVMRSALISKAVELFVINQGKIYLIIPAFRNKMYAETNGGGECHFLVNSAL